ADAGLRIDALNPYDVGVLIGTSHAGEESALASAQLLFGATGGRSISSMERNTSCPSPSTEEVPPGGDGPGDLVPSDEAYRGATPARAPRVSARLVPRMLGNMGAAEVAMDLGLRGASFSIGSACATGAHSIGEAGEI